MVKKIIIFAIVCLFNYTTSAQQEAQYSMYFFNPLLINPGYAGSQEALTATAVVRDQWNGLAGAPKSQCLTVHSPLKKEALGLGLTVLNDVLGPTKNTGGYLDFSYGIKLNKHKDRLVFGLKMGVDYMQRDFSKLRINDQNDNIYLDNFSYNKTLLNVGAGMYYYGKRYYLGVSSPRLVKNKLNLISDQTAIQENHYYAFGGIVVKINPLINMRPSFMIKYVKNAPLSLEGNLSFLINEKVWLGAVYRHNSFMGLNAMYQITPSLKLGYAYDYTLTKLQNYSNGSHELMLSYDLRKMVKGFKSPRYF